MKRYTGELATFAILLSLSSFAWFLIRDDWQSVPELQPQKLERVLRPAEHVSLAATKQGWGKVEQKCLTALITRENRSWNPKAKNPTSSASGLFQVLRSASGVMARDLPMKDQARLGVKYIRHRYDSPCRALDYHFRHGWY